MGISRHSSVWLLLATLTLMACDSEFLLEGTVVNAPLGEGGAVYTSANDEAPIGAPVHEANVTLIWGSGPDCDENAHRDSTTRELQTNADGTFFFHFITGWDRKWTCLRVSKPGYESINRAWERDPGGIGSILVSLQEMHP